MTIAHHKSNLPNSIHLIIYMTYAEKYPDEQKYREMLGAESITFYRDKMMELIDTSANCTDMYPVRICLIT